MNHLDRILSERDLNAIARILCETSTVVFNLQMFGGCLGLLPAVVGEIIQTSPTNAYNSVLLMLAQWTSSTNETERTLSALLAKLRGINLNAAADEIQAEFGIINRSTVGRLYYASGCICFTVLAGIGLAIWLLAIFLNSTRASDNQWQFVVKSTSESELESHTLTLSASFPAHSKDMFVKQIEVRAEICLPVPAPARLRKYAGTELQPNKNHYTDGDWQCPPYCDVKKDVLSIITTFSNSDECPESTNTHFKAPTRKMFELLDELYTELSKIMRSICFTAYLQILNGIEKVACSQMCFPEFADSKRCFSPFSRICAFFR